MDLLIIFSLILATIVWSILINRLVHCPILIGFAFFSIFLIVATILSNTTYIIAAILLGILAFISAFLDCVISRSGFFRNNNCLVCDTCYTNRNNNCNNNCNNDENEMLTIVNSNGEVVARIDGNSVTCKSSSNSGCCNRR